MTRELRCDPPSGLVAVDGFSFYRDQDDAIIARCVWCCVGYRVTEESATEVRHALRTHLLVIHGVGDRLRPEW